MLTTPQIAANDIVTLKLNTGEEIVGKVVSTDQTTITLIKPIAIQLQMVAPGQAGIGFAPFLASVDENSNITYSKNNLACYPVKTRADVKAKYIEATTGIAIAQPTNGIIR